MEKKIQKNSSLKVAVLKLVLCSILFIILGIDVTQKTDAIANNIPVEVTVPSTTLVVSGYAPPNSFVTILENNAAIGTGITNSSGNYVINLGTQTPGLKTISVNFLDKNGVSSKIITRQTNIVSQRINKIEIKLNPTINLRSLNTIQKGDVLFVSGYSYPNSIQTLNLNGNTPGVYIANSNANGYYEFLITTANFQESKYTISVKTTFPDQTTSQTSETLSFTIESARGPIVPDIITNPNILPPPTILSPLDNSVIDGDFIDIFGDALPGTQINIFENNVLFGSVFANVSGKWSFRYNARSSPVTLSFEACREGECSVISSPLNLNFENINLCTQSFILEIYRFWNINVRDAISLNLIGIQGSDNLFSVDWGDGTTEKFNSDSKDNVEIFKSFEQPGQYNGKITLSSQNKKCEFERYFSVHVIDSDKESQSSLSWLFFLSTSILLGIYLSKKDTK